MKIKFSDPVLSHRINKFLHGSFFEYFGETVYDGIWVGKDSCIPNIDGIRLSIVECLKQAGITMLRWPGGCCADHYHWQYGVGKTRYPHIHPMPPPKLWRHDFGTDEFLKLCSLTHTEPMIVANTATGSVWDFLTWYEYVNGPEESGFGKMRADNGHPKPYDVKYWGLGNTDENVWWPYENDPEAYAVTFRRFITAIRDLRPDIKIISAGLNSMHPERPEWNKRFLSYTNAHQGRTSLGPDFISNHQYIGAYNPRDRICSDAVDYCDEAYYESLNLMDKYYKSDIDALRKDITENTPMVKITSEGHAPGADVTRVGSITAVSFDEWGMWHPEARQNKSSRQRQTMRDAIFAAGALHLFYRESDIVKIAMQTQTVNLLQSLMETRGGDFFLTPTFWVMKLFKEHCGQFLVETIKDAQDAFLDCVVSMNDVRDKIVITAVNRDLYNEKVIEPLIDEPYSKWQVTEADIIAPCNVRDYNSFDFPDKIKAVSYLTGPFEKIRMPKHSIIRIVYERKPGS